LKIVVAREPLRNTLKSTYATTPLSATGMWPCEFPTPTEGRALDPCVENRPSRVPTMLLKAIVENPEYRLPDLREGVKRQMNL
jgi:hypothetical protein